MSTDAVIQFNFSDGEHFISLYKKSDCFHENIKFLLEEVFNKLQDQFGAQDKKGRLNYDYIVPHVISHLTHDNYTERSIKLLPCQVDNDDQSFIYLYIIEPIAEKYANPEKYTYMECFKVTCRYSSDKQNTTEIILTTGG